MKKNYTQEPDITEIIEVIVGNVSLWGETSESKNLKARLETVADIAYLRGIAEGINRAEEIKKYE